KENIKASVILTLILQKLTHAYLYALQRCRCRKQTSDVISAWKISFIEVIPRGIQCRRKEIMQAHRNPNPKPQGNSTTTPPPPHLYSLL
uniref:Uncharacterized protein n=1 Tax=Chrysemys picta bellii TaxID=8478 RepID=A0A8C3I2K0_CHRPI